MDDLGIRFAQKPWEDEGLSPIDWLYKHFRDFMLPVQQILEKAVPYQNSEGPFAPGVYFLIYEERVRYVGLSVDIGFRLLEHSEAGKPFTHYSWIEVPDLLLPHVEAFYIHWLKPEWNVRYLHVGGEVIRQCVDAAISGELFNPNYSLHRPRSRRPARR